MAAVLPKQVRDQVDAVNRRYAAMNKVSSDDGEDAGEELAADAEDRLETATDPADENESSGAAQVDGDSESEEIPTPQTPPKPSEDFKQKYKTLQGMYDRQARELHQMRDDLSQMRQLLGTMQNSAPAPTPQEDPDAPLVTPEEMEEYGTDFFEVVGKKAREIAAREVKQLKQDYDKRLTELQQRVGGVAQAEVSRARASMMDTLSSEVPDWEEQNNDQGFLNWLGEPDPFSGVARGAMLKQAYEKNDAARVVAFFKAYRNEIAAVTPPTTSSKPAPARAPQVKMDTLAAPGPGRAGTHADTRDGKKRVWTRTEISKFYRDATDGYFKGRESERQQIERGILEAISEGRVR